MFFQFIISKTKITFDEGYGWKPGYLRPNADLKIGQNASVSSSDQKLLTFFGFQKHQYILPSYAKTFW